MRLNGIILCVLVGIGSVFLVCSRSDVISGVADKVISDGNPSLTDTADFVLIYLDSADVDSAYSLPAKAAPAFSTTFADVIIGVNGQGDTLAAHLQYNIAADSARYKDSGSLILEGVYLYFPTDSAATDSISPSASVSLDWVNPLDKSEPVNRGVDGRHPDASKDTAWPQEFTLGGGKEVDSVKLPESAAEKIFGTRISKTDTSTFAFNLADYYGTARRIKNPYMAIVTCKEEVADSGNIVRDTLIDTIRAESSRFTVFEDADSVQYRVGLPYSSRHAKRTAVFDISLDKITRELTGEYTNLNAVITLKPGRNLGAADSSYRVFVSDTLFDESYASYADSLDERFKKSSSLRPVTPYYTLSVNSPLQRVLGSKKSGKKYLYVYLRADSDDGAILWGRELIGVQTVFIRLP